MDNQPEFQKILGIPLVRQMTYAVWQQMLNYLKLIIYIKARCLIVDYNTHTHTSTSTQAHMHTHTHTVTNMNVWMIFLYQNHFKHQRNSLIAD